VIQFDPEPTSASMESLIKLLNNATESDSGFFAETWSDTLVSSLDTNDFLYDLLESTQVNTTFPDTNLGRQLQTVSRMIATHKDRGENTNFFFVQKGGFDTHGDLGDRLIELFSDLNGALTAFVEELKRIGMWDKVTLMQTSEFARTVKPNSGNGTDHAWGGNYFMFGGDVNGGEIYGKYPTFTGDNPLYLEDRGRIIPDTPWEAPFEALNKWIGITDAEVLDQVLPNRNKFSASALLQEYNLFKTG